MKNSLKDEMANKPIRRFNGLLAKGESWRDLSAEQALKKLQAAVGLAIENPVPELIADAVLWYQLLLLLLDDPDDLDQLWMKLVRQHILPVEWSLWQRCADQLWAKSLRD